jgi:hypothetical protein
MALQYGLAKGTAHTEDNWSHAFSPTNSELNMRSILLSFDQLTDDKKSCGHFMQSNATARTAKVLLIY